MIIFSTSPVIILYKLCLNDLEVIHIHTRQSSSLCCYTEAWVDMETSIAVDMETSIAGGQNSKYQPGLFIHTLT